jgi:hypothetical protein
MADYQFSVIIPMPPMTHEDIVDATAALGNAGCLDASIRGHADGMEILLERTAESLQTAIFSAISDVERAGYHVSKVELEGESIPV